MRKLLLLSILLASAACTPQVSASDDKEEYAVPDNPGDPVEAAAASAAAERFFSLVDKGKATQAWPSLAGLMTNNVDLPAWEASLANMHDDIGDIQQRRQIKIGLTDGLGDIPSGRYYIIQYSSKFEHADASEQVTVVLEDHAWKVGGYFTYGIQRH